MEDDRMLMCDRYTGIWNLLDYTAAVFPSGVFADENIDVKDDENLPVLSPADKTTKDRCKPFSHASSIIYRLMKF
jgi:hypothetical protein